MWMSIIINDIKRNKYYLNKNMKPFTIMKLIYVANSKLWSFKFKVFFILETVKPY